jgi:hypothetical protein
MAYGPGSIFNVRRSWRLGNESKSSAGIILGLLALVMASISFSTLYTWVSTIRNSRTQDDFSLVRQLHGNPNDFLWIAQIVVTLVIFCCGLYILGQITTALIFIVKLIGEGGVGMATSFFAVISAAFSIAIGCIIALITAVALYLF